jgi:peptidoglycan/LPS O-acetylase OafA/YrhL
MNFRQKLTSSLQRVTSSGNYIPEIDGLRFIAIFFVVIMAHGGTYITRDVLHTEDKSSFLYHFLLEGVSGVSLFFIISGFILSVPFAKEKILQQSPVKLKQYYWRRVTRLEPVYITTLIIYFIFRVYFLKHETFGELLPHFFASLFYVHNIVFNDHSLVNGVAWSLEVEIQFYLLMPLLAFLYAIKQHNARRLILLILIIAGAVYSYIHQYRIANIFNKGCYFIAGMLLADLYVTDKKNYDSYWYTAAGLLCFIISIFIPAYYVSVWFCAGKVFLMMGYFYWGIKNITLKKILSFTPIAIIGGMCYSIYLLHPGIIGLLMYSVAKIQFSENIFINGCMHLLITITSIFIVSAVFFLLVEKPTMKKDWWKRRKNQDL